MSIRSHSDVTSTGFLGVLGRRAIFKKILRNTVLEKMVYRAVSLGHCGPTIEQVKSPISGCSVRPKGAAIRHKNLDALIARDAQLFFLDELIREAERSLSPSRILLFGSRARVDAGPRSDVDLAFEFNEIHRKNWPKFCAEIDEGYLTLLPLDLVDLNCAAIELKRAIEREGIELYGS